MGEWCYALCSIEFSTLNTDEDFSRYYIDNFLKLTENLGFTFYINKKINENGWILTLNYTTKNGIFIGDIEGKLYKFLRLFYQYFAINNVTASLYNECGTTIHIDSTFLDFDKEILAIDEKYKYDTNTLRKENQTLYIERYNMKKWETIRDMCLGLPVKEFQTLVDDVNKYKKED